MHHHDLPQAHADAVANTQAIIAAVTADQLGLPTPCEDWDVKELLHHIIYGNWWVRPLVEGETIEQVGDRFEGDILGDDFVKAGAESGVDAVAAFQAEGAMEAPCAVSYGPVPGEIYCGHRLLDVLVHGWDLAKATGGNTELPDDLVEACIEVATPQAEMLLESGVFGHLVEPPEHADRQTLLLAMLGRQA